MVSVTVSCCSAEIKRKTMKLYAEWFGSTLQLTFVSKHLKKPVYSWHFLLKVHSYVVVAIRITKWHFSCLYSIIGKWEHVQTTSFSSCFLFYYSHSQSLGGIRMNQNNYRRTTKRTWSQSCGKSTVTTHLENLNPLYFLFIWHNMNWCDVSSFVCSKMSIRIRFEEIYLSV